MPSRTRTYGQFCGLARALEIIGERWSLLIVRDLVLGPKRLNELRDGLPSVSPDVLAVRLTDLEDAGVLRRGATGVYELTEYGGELDHILVDLGLWGARSLSRPGPEENFTLDAAILALYTAFRSETAGGVQLNFEIHQHDTMVLHALVDDGALKVAEGRYPGADLIIRTAAGPGLLDVIGGSVTPFAAVSSGKVQLEGDFADFALFARIFHVAGEPDALAA